RRDGQGRALADLMEEARETASLRVSRGERAQLCAHGLDLALERRGRDPLDPARRQAAHRTEREEPEPDPPCEIRVPLTALEVAEHGPGRDGAITRRRGKGRDSV